ncbi:hypothetical protein Sango_0028000 [Sesamum angolense]|uniref:Reverse transcriptase domain-containing protein n=1 Tax=Sesamum angolense TaxID=2727404 RepID=A0AAE2C5N0_9LAMI|nr:hypothetical protein Sango_0028000 [Sesamum angolense]
MKLMTIWLGHILPKVLSLSQSGFVPGRLLSDNVLLAQELIHSLESRRREANVVFKLDMAKAYDRGWTMTNLSHGGRLALIQSVLHATLLHLFQVIHPPKSVLTTIESIFNGFFGCCEVEETVSHLFIESTAVQGVWQHFAALFGLCLCDTGSLTHVVHFWWYSTPFHLDLHIRTLIPFLILWFTWTHRNIAKYHGVPLSTDDIILEIVPQALSIVRWRAPSPSWFKLNTDGSSFGNLSLVGVANIIRDSAGHVHLAYQVILGTETSMLAELTAVCAGFGACPDTRSSPLAGGGGYHGGDYALTVPCFWKVGGRRMTQLTILRRRLLLYNWLGCFTIMISRVFSATFSALTDGESLTFAGGDDDFMTWTRSFRMSFLWLVLE